MNVFADDHVPYFAWDRSMTAGQLRRSLEVEEGLTWLRTAAWLMREADPSAVWAFLTPEEVDTRLTDLLPLLGRRREFWEYLIGAWRGLGKL